jgi:hypothetical protein
MTKKSLSHLAEEEWIHAIGAIMASLAAKGIVIVGNAKVEISLDCVN